MVQPSTYYYTTKYEVFNLTFLDQFYMASAEPHDFKFWVK